MARFNFTYELRAEDRLIAEICGRCEILDGDIYVEFETIPTSGGYVPVPSWMERDVVDFLRNDPVYQQRLSDARAEDRHEIIARERRIARANTLFWSAFWSAAE